MEGSRIIVALKGLHPPPPPQNSQTGRQSHVLAAWTPRAPPLSPPLLHLSAECKWQVAPIHQGPADLGNKRRGAGTRDCCQIGTEGVPECKAGPGASPSRRPEPLKARHQHLFFGPCGPLRGVDGCQRALRQQIQQDTDRQITAEIHTGALQVHTNKCASRAAEFGNIDSACRIFLFRPNSCRVRPEQMTRPSISLIQIW